MLYPSVTSWLSFVMSNCDLSLSHWYPWSGVVLDCIDSWYLPSFLLWMKLMHLSKVIDWKPKVWQSGRRRRRHYPYVSSMLRRRHNKAPIIHLILFPNFVFPDVQSMEWTAYLQHIDNALLKELQIIRKLVRRRKWYVHYRMLPSTEGLLNNMAFTSNEYPSFRRGVCVWGGGVSHNFKHVIWF